MSPQNQAVRCPPPSVGHAPPRPPCCACSRSRSPASRPRPGRTRRGPSGGTCRAGCRRLGFGLGGFAYYANALHFADALRHETRGWRHLDGEERVGPADLDADGYYTAGGRVFAQPFQNNNLPGNYPAGRYVVTWEGTGDVNLPQAQLGGGSAEERRKVYRVTNPSGVGLKIVVDSAPAPDHVRDVRVWMPDPENPSLASLEPAAGEPGPLFHPEYVAHLQASADDFGVIRFMDWLETNNNAQATWADRRPPTHAFTSGGNLDREVTLPGTDDAGKVGIAWEHVARLANAAGTDAWVNLPHAADDEYVRNAARVLRYGSAEDGRPYDGPVADPHHPPLDEGLRVWVEHSNEIWSGGGNFRQGEWAQRQADAAGHGKKEITNGRRAAEIFDLWAEVWEPGRTVRVAAAFTAVPKWYTRGYLDALDTRAAELGGPGPDVMAVTTYFGQPIVGRIFNDLDWRSADPSDPRDPVVAEAVDILINDLVLAGGGASGERGSSGGGFGPENSALAEEYGLPIVAYEGGPSIYTEGAPLHVVDKNDPEQMRVVPKDTPDSEGLYSLANYVAEHFPRDRRGLDRFTEIVVAMNRHPRFAEAYRANLSRGLDLGLVTHLAFVDVGGWGKHGQWGHKEYLGQPDEQAVKWRAVLEWARETDALTPADGLIDAPANLPVPVGSPADLTLAACPGAELAVVAGTPQPGLTIGGGDGTLTLTGTADGREVRRLLVRAVLPDGRADWHVVTLKPA